MPKTDGPVTAGNMSKPNRHVTAGVKQVYKVIQQSTGAVGGYGHDGPIYGELTMGTFQKLVNYLRTHLGFGPASSFLDIGSGLGKPNLHAAVDPGVKLSMGVELEELRWKLSMHNLRNCAQKCPGLRAAQEVHQRPNLFFAKADITDFDNFAPFTHIYMFDVGFPPDALVQIANAFNASKSVKALISFQRPLHIIQTYGFAVKLLDKITTRMCGSSESHTAYVYESLFNVRSKGGDKQVAAVEEQEAPVGPPGATPSEGIASRTRGNQRSPVKQKRRQQMQLDQMLPKRQKRSSPSKAAKETPGAGKAKPQILFPSDPSLITQRGLDIIGKLPSSDPASPYPAWLEATGRLETPDRPKRPQARRVLYT